MISIHDGPVGIRLACIGNYPPRQCGIATFTADLCRAMVRALGDPQSCQIVAMNDSPSGYAYPKQVRFEIRQQVLADYRQAADYLNIRNFDLLLVQHEFGIFGGPAGRHLLTLLADVKMPVVTTMHTVLADADPEHREVTDQLIRLSDAVVVMAERAVDILRTTYSVPTAKVVMIPHGIPDLPFSEPAAFKKRLNVAGRTVMLTFGLLSPGKGIEYVIQALPSLVKDHPDLLYVVLGATHPQIRRTQGEQYRYGLQQLASRLGVADHVMFLDRYVNLDVLCDALRAADIYVTPYLNQEQIVSGTLAYAMGAGTAVISTPYWYAQEMLADGRGRLVPPRDADAIAREVGELLKNDSLRQRVRRRAYRHTRRSVWKEVARQYLDLIAALRRQRAAEQQATDAPAGWWSESLALPDLELGHLRELTDDVGILQHATFTVPNRQHGYCTDDNARALAVAVEAHEVTGDPALAALARRYASFLHHAWNPERGRFRNFLSYERRWLDEVGSEDSHARALAGLAGAIRMSSDEGLRHVAMTAFQRGFAAAEQFDSMRSCAVSIRAADLYLQRFAGDSAVKRLRDTLADRVFARLEAHRSDDWVWPEDSLTYSNAAIPHALLVAGQALGRDDMVAGGLDSLRWLLGIKRRQTGCISLIGSDGWMQRGGQCALFAQQPINAQAFIEAAITAYHITGDEEWREAARECFEWFLGRNVRNQVLYDFQSGGCRDGLEDHGVNENQGAESLLAWLASLIAIQQLVARFESGQIAEGSRAGGQLWRRDRRHDHAPIVAAPNAPPVATK